jgi:hypothetical protein
VSIDGTPKFGTISVREIVAEITQAGPNITGKAAFVDRTTGNTHGWTQGTGAVWSEVTRGLLMQLAASMEQDLANLHFIGGAGATGREESKPLFSGIAEHLEEADQA